MMVPFRVFDRDNKEMWIVLNYQTDGTYLIAREADDERDGEMRQVNTKELVNYRLVDFLDDGEGA
jgi:hypothetical protein